MKKYLTLIFLIVLLNVDSMEQHNRVPESLPVVYPFSINIKLNKQYNLIRADLPNSDKLIRYQEENWSTTMSDSLQLSLMALKPGHITVPEIPVIIFDDLGADTLYTKSFEIDVITTTDSTSQLTSIRPIAKEKNPLLIEVKLNWLWSSLLVVGCLLLLTIIIWLIYRNFREIKKWLVKNKIIEEKIEQEPWDFALAELNRIRKNFLVSKHYDYQFSIEISLLIRRFLEYYYSFPAAERTTFELSTEVKKMDIDQADEIISLLKKLDQIKYTKGKLVADFDSSAIDKWVSDYLISIKEKEERKADSQENVK